MWIALFVLLGFAGLALGAVWLVRSLRAELEGLRADSGAQLAERSAEVDRRLEAMTSTLDRRLESTTKTAGDIHRQLGELGRANEEILARANDLKRLEHALRPPKARGGFGELLLEKLPRGPLSPAAALGSRRLRRAAAGEPAARPASTDGVLAAIRIFERRARRRRDQGRPHRPDRLQVPVRQLRAHGVRRERHRTAAAREVVRARREGPHRRDRVQVHPPRRGNVRLRIHVPPVGGDLLRARVREDGRAAYVRTRQARAASL